MSDDMEEDDTPRRRESDFVPSTLEAVWTRVLDDDYERRSAHKRVGKRLTAMQDELDSLIQQVGRNKIELNEIKNRDVNAAKLVLTTKQWIAVTFFVVTIAGSFWGSTSGVRADVATVSTKVDYLSKTEDDRYNDIKQKLEEMKKQREQDKEEAQKKLDQFLQQDLKETIIAHGAKK